ncbi:MAG TPA: beta-ketoacyl synthase N-terminal-like domain-containing protein, partial [Candidatus Acidoferrales bacterium]|nr:beta-ketoacyl synthase N-terminal-like domain-containing protein [Candidatus Acidoferrales bacterium]
IARRLLGVGVFELLGAGIRKPAADEALLGDAEQVGIYLEGFLFARLALARMTPDVVVGHSFGEFAALATAGVVSFADGVELVCERVRALRRLRGTGRMLAVAMSREHAIDALRSPEFATLDISVVNHPEQTVVSGPEETLLKFKTRLGESGVASTLLASRLPFHSRLLVSAVEPFRDAIRRIAFGAAHIPLFLPVEERLYDGSLDMAELLAAHLVTPFDFCAAVRLLYQSGYRQFCECAGSSTLRKVVSRTLAGEREQLILDDPEVAMPREETVRASREVAAQTQPQEVQIQEDIGLEPIAIVGYGCVLPGALNAERFWDHLLDGTGSVISCETFDPHFGDFYTERVVTPNRTYSKLMGYVDDEALDVAFGKLGLDGSKRYAKVQKITAVALHEALTSYQAGQKRTTWAEAVCYFGATPDGIKEYDEALAFERFASGVRDEDTSEETRARLADIAKRFGAESKDVDRFAPRSVYRTIVHDVLGAPVKTVVVDTACSSSLYALDMGIKALAAGESDTAFCVGAFAPGIGNNCLFAQFKGLATTGVRAFDKAAEGTVFGDGGAVVIARRLRDALRDGDSIYGVVRGVGLSSDGKAPAVNVPTVPGQRLAIERAYGSSKVNPRTIQFVEGHATGTTGDAIEFRSLASAFGESGAGAEKIRLGSVKSLIGHTGWASGLASFIKILLAFRARVMPAQHGLNEINPDIDLAQSPFTFSRQNEPWKPNTSGLPRRAGINSFGFGGTNIHMIVEDYDERYHRALSRVAAPARLMPAASVVAMNALLPGEHGRTDATSGRFDRSTFALPAGLRLLPDVLDTMSSEQLLALMGCGSVVDVLREKGVDLRRVAVVISGYSKAERARIANDFI